MSTYKLIKKNQFAYGPVTSRNGDKISVALLDDYEVVMISQAYTSFEVVDKNELLPEYLMMWFRRPEFDRYARFMSQGSAREIFGWEEMCNTTLPVPSITKQKEIVKEYNVLVDRINLNNRLIQKLEETAQAIYKQWFVDFEFPDENGMPYKSNGGEMEFNKELDKEIPSGWEFEPIKSISKAIVCGKTPPTVDETNFGKDIPFLTIPDMHNKVYVDSTQRSLSIKGANTQRNKTLPPNTICVSCIASPGLVILTEDACQTNQQINSIICKDSFSYLYGYFAINEIGYKIKEWGIGASVGANLNTNSFSTIKILVPLKGCTDNFHDTVKGIFDLIKNYQKQRLLLEDLKDLSISKVVLDKWNS
jgi:type I restriction enzyme S subunit